MLDLRHVTKTYRKGNTLITPVRDFALTVDGGDLVAVHGPSGCGKTTLLLVAGGLLHPDLGSVQINGQDLYQLSAEALARFRAGHIGFVFQQFHLIPYLSVLDNVLASGLAVTVPNRRQRAHDLLNQFGLTHRLSHRPAELSTGERQRTALARALLNKPTVLLADEPTGNLDEENGRIVLEYLADYARQGGAVLLVTHDRRAAGMAHRLVPLGDASGATLEKVS